MWHLQFICLVLSTYDALKFINLINQKILTCTSSFRGTHNFNPQVINLFVWNIIHFGFIQYLLYHCLILQYSIKLWIWLLLNSLNIFLKKSLYLVWWGAIAFSPGFMYILTVFKMANVGFGREICRDTWFWFLCLYLLSPTNSFFSSFDWVEANLSQPCQCG